MKTIKHKTTFRNYEIRAGGIDKDNRTVELSFASDEPVLMRHEYGHDRVYEILSHETPDYSRLENGGPLLIGHYSGDQVGAVRKCWTKPDDGKKKSYALAQFGRSQRADEIFQDVIDEIRKNVSTGYNVYEARQTAEIDGIPVFTATRWEPLEISIVPIPADPSVGIGRNSEIITEFDLQIVEEIEKSKSWNLNIDLKI